MCAGAALMLLSAFLTCAQQKSPHQGGGDWPLVRAQGALGAVTPHAHPPAVHPPVVVVSKPATKQRESRSTVD